MMQLIRFELKKLVGRRVAQVASIGIFLLICLIMALNVMQAKTLVNVGEQLSGPAAIAQTKARTNEHAGLVTAERAAADVADYRARAYANVSPDALAGASMGDAYDLMVEAYGEDELVSLFNDYYTWLMNPFKPQQGMDAYQYAMSITDEQLADYYGQVDQALRASLEQGTPYWTYSDAEIDFWMEKRADVRTPLEYGYAGGWENILYCLGFFAFVILGVGIVVAPAFTAEYSTRADAVVLSTRYGKGRLAAAKVAAAFIFATGYFAACAAVIVGVSLAFYGTDGANLPNQVLRLTSPYALTASQMTWISIGLAYLMTIGFTAFALLLSAKLRSPMAIFAILVALVLGMGVIGGFSSGAFIHIKQLFPLDALNPSPLFWNCESYPFGPVVISLAGMVAIVYATVCALCTPLAIRGFSRHQVA